MRQWRRVMNTANTLTSPLLNRIAKAIEKARPAKGILRVSVSPRPKWEPSPNGEQVLVRWICWSVNDGDREVVAPEFDVVRQEVTKERLAAELPAVFPGIEVIVDNETDM
jgi:hypothetical protein